LRPEALVTVPLMVDPGFIAASIPAVTLPPVIRMPAALTNLVLPWNHCGA